MKIENIVWRKKLFSTRSKTNQSLKDMNGGMKKSYLALEKNLVFDYMVNFILVDNDKNFKIQENGKYINSRP